MPLQETIQLTPVEKEPEEEYKTKSEWAAEGALRQLEYVVAAKQEILNGLTRGLKHADNADVNAAIELIRNQMKTELVDLQLQHQLTRLLHELKGDKSQLVRVLSGIRINIV